MHSFINFREQYSIFCNGNIVRMITFYFPYKWTLQSITVARAKVTDVISIYNRHQKLIFPSISSILTYSEARVTFLGVDPMLSPIRFCFSRNWIQRKKNLLPQHTYVSKSAN